MCVCIHTYWTRNGNPLQQSCLENPMDRGAWWATVHGVTKNRSQLKWLGMCSCMHTYMHIYTYTHIIYIIKCLYVCVGHVLSRVWLSAAPWTVALQASLSMEFFRQEYWSELPFPPPGYLPNPRIKPASPMSSALQAVLYLLSHWGSPIKCL